MTARHTTQSIAELTGGELVGPGDLAIASLAEIGHARAGQLTFIGTDKYAGKWARSGATAALVGRDIDLLPGDGKALIRVDNADLAMAKVLEAFAPATPLPPEGVDPSAVIAQGVTLGQGVRVGPHCVLKPGVTIGDHTVLHAGVIVFNDTAIGSHCELWSGAVVRERCTVGDRCILHANAVVGADGFGYRLDTSGDMPKLVKVPQIGVVRIGNDVEIGAGTTIDRAKFDATVIGDGCKLDNLVQIGHNVVLGRMVVIAGCTGVAGSTTIGDGTMIGGQTAVSDHLTIGSRCQIAGGAAVINDIPDGGKWGGVPAKPMKEAIAAELALRKLPELMRDMKRAKRQADKEEARSQE